MLLQACEAPLKLGAVIEQESKASHRSDRFQQINSNDSSVVVVGSFGVILVSNDKGDTWKRTQLSSQPSFIDITHCPDKSYVALTLEGAVWLSSDNGNSWQEKSLMSEETPQAITCAPDGKIWVVGSFSTFLSSNDKGESWLSVSLDEDMILSYIKFFNHFNGIATGEFGSLLTTNDGGLTWQTKNPMPNEFYPIASLFSSMNDGIVVGLSGKILATHNGGNTWQVEQSNTKVPLYGLTKNDRYIYATGALGSLLVKDLSMSSAAWTQFPQQTRSYLRGALAFENKLIIVGGKGLLKNADLANSEAKND
jgi:photosystem II stability/assembly factor-like uncharacterized protein